MSKEILINIGESEKRIAILDKSRLQDFFIEHPHDKTIVGNIYKARIKDIVPSVGAAFVDIGQPKNGFLYLSDISGLSNKEDFDFESDQNIQPQELKLEKNKEILVQVTKEPFSGKGARLTTHISLPGRYFVLMPFDRQLGISRKIDDPEERLRIKEILRSIKETSDYGLIVRTAAWGRDKKALSQDFYFLLNLWQKIKNASNRSYPPSLLYEDYDLVLRTLRDYFTEEITRLIVDSKFEYRRIYKFVSTFYRPLTKKLQLYKDRKIPLFDKFRVEEQIDEIFDKKIYLNCGGHIIIEQTEGLIVVDVNSGGFSKKKLEQEEAVFVINTEAAKEIARQLRLRDLSGIIVIDFIDMQKESNRKKLLKILKIALSEDKAKTDVVGISRLGVVEMTRERTRRSVESIFYKDCPYCCGRGKVKSESSIVNYVFRYLRKELNNINSRNVKVYVHPSIAKMILQEHRASIRNLESIFRKKILILEDSTLHIEAVKVLGVS